MKNTRKKLKNIRSKTKRNIKKMGGANQETAPITTTAPVTTTAPTTTTDPTTTTAPVTTTTATTSKEDVSKLLSDIAAKIDALPADNPNKEVFTKILSQLKEVELSDTIIETLRTFLSKIESIKIDPNKINEINNKLASIEEEIKENNEIKINNEKISESNEGQEEPALSGKLAHLTFPIELLDAVKNCINHARNYDFVKVGPSGEELIE